VILSGCLQHATTILPLHMRMLLHRPDKYI